LTPSINNPARVVESDPFNRQDARSAKKEEKRISATNGHESFLFFLVCFPLSPPFVNIRVHSWLKFFYRIIFFPGDPGVLAVLLARLKRLPL
jgi:hypothetical protein